MNEVNTSSVAPIGADPPAAAEVSAPEMPENLGGISPGQLRKELAELKNAFAEFSRNQLPESERIRQDLAEVRQKHQAAEQQLQTLQRANAVKSLSDTHGFKEVDYLDFLLSKNSVDPMDDDAAKDFMQHLQSSSPGFFQHPVKSGAGSRPESGAAAALNVLRERGVSELEMLLAYAPELN